MKRIWNGRAGVGGRGLGGKMERRLKEDRTDNVLTFPAYSLQNSGMFQVQLNIT